MARASMPEASRNQMVDGWVRAVQSGKMARPDFDRAIDDAVGGGLLTEGEGAATKQQLA